MSSINVALFILLLAPFYLLLYVTLTRQRGTSADSVLNAPMPLLSKRAKRVSGIVVLSILAVIGIQQLFFNTFHAWLYQPADGSEYMTHATTAQEPWLGRWCEWGANDAQSNTTVYVSDYQLAHAAPPSKETIPKDRQAEGQVVTYHAWLFGLFNQAVSVQNVKYDEYGCMDRYAWLKSY